MSDKYLLLTRASEYKDGLERVDSIVTIKWIDYVVENSSNRIACIMNLSSLWDYEIWSNEWGEMEILDIMT